LDKIKLQKILDMMHRKGDCNWKEINGEGVTEETAGTYTLNLAG
jgi:hypothetical protein